MGQALEGISPREGDRIRIVLSIIRGSVSLSCWLLGRGLVVTSPGDIRIRSLHSSPRGFMSQESSPA